MAWQQLIGWLLLFGVIVYLVTNHSDDRVRKVCRRAQVGSAVAELNVYARELGLSDRIISTGATSLVEGRPGGYMRDRGGRRRRARRAIRQRYGLKCPSGEVRNQLL
jgi:hypothetical protein